MVKLVLVRGLPGSGKTTFAKRLPALHLEADMFFVRDGQYSWSGNLVRRAHVWCQDFTHRALNQGMDVVVSNTFTTLKELEPYLTMNYSTLEVVRMTGDYGSIHEVPEETIRKMSQRFQDYPGELVI